MRRVMHVPRRGSRALRAGGAADDGGVADDGGAAAAVRGARQELREAPRDAAAIMRASPEASAALAPRALRLLRERVATLHAALAAFLEGYSQGLREVRAPLARSPGRVDAIAHGRVVVDGPAAVCWPVTTLGRRGCAHMAAPAAALPPAPTCCTMGLAAHCTARAQRASATACRKAAACRNPAPCMRESRCRQESCLRHACSAGVQVESGKVDLAQDARGFYDRMMHTLPAALEGSNVKRAPECLPSQGQGAADAAGTKVSSPGSSPGTRSDGSEGR
jgi:hypothetical protein